jgi:hypothetical protein
MMISVLIPRSHQVITESTVLMRMRLSTARQPQPRRTLSGSFMNAWPSHLTSRLPRGSRVVVVRIASTSLLRSASSACAVHFRTKPQHPIESAALPLELDRQRPRTNSRRPTTRVARHAVTVTTMDSARTSPWRSIRCGGGCRPGAGRRWRRASAPSPGGCRSSQPLSRLSLPYVPGEGRLRQAVRMSSSCHWPAARATGRTALTATSMARAAPEAGGLEELEEGGARAPVWPARLAPRSARGPRPRLPRHQGASPGRRGDAARRCGGRGSPRHSGVQRQGHACARPYSGGPHVRGVQGAGDRGRGRRRRRDWPARRGSRGSRRRARRQPRTRGGAARRGRP